VDVVKTRLMTQKPDADGKLPYQGLVQSIMKVLLLCRASVDEVARRLLVRKASWP